MVFHWSLSDGQSPQVSRTLLSILTDLNNAVFGTVSTLPVISKSSSPCTNLLMTVPRAQITIGIIVTLIFHCFCIPLARSRYLSLFLLSFSFTLWSAGTAKSTILQVLSFFMIIIRSGGQVESWWSFCLSKSQRSLRDSFFRKDAELCICHLFVWSNLSFWHNSQWIILNNSHV